MSTQTATTSINGRDYFVTQMAPTKAILVQLQLSKILGATFGALIPTLGDKSKADNGERMAAMGTAINALFAAASEAEIVDLISRVVSTASVNGTRINVDNDFQGEYLADLYKVFFWVLGVNYSSFFGENGLDGMLEKFKKLAAQELAKMSGQTSPAPQPQTSTPGSGDQ